MIRKLIAYLYHNTAAVEALNRIDEIGTRIVSFDYKGETIRNATLGSYEAARVGCGFDLSRTVFRLFGIYYMRAIDNNKGHVVRVFKLAHVRNLEGLPWQVE